MYIQYYISQTSKQLLNMYMCTHQLNGAVFSWYGLWEHLQDYKSLIVAHVDKWLLVEDQKLIADFQTAILLDYTCTESLIQ